MSTLVLLGGYGGAGRALAPLLLRCTDARLVIAGRNLEKAQVLARELGDHERVRAARADALAPESLRPLLAPGDMLLDLTTAGESTAELARLALARGADFLDIHFQRRTALALAQLDEDFRRAGRLLLTQAGCHPGLPAALVRAAAADLDPCREARVAMALDCRVETQATAMELVEEIAAATGVLFRDGSWREAGPRDMPRLDFGPGLGRRVCYPMLMEELLPLPARLGLDVCGGYAAGFNPLADRVVIPLALLWGRTGPRAALPALARLFAWSVNVLASSRPAICFLLDAKGRRNGAPARLRIRVESDDPYGLTAQPVALALRQRQEGHLRETGLRHLGSVLDPEQLLKHLEATGAHVSRDLQPA